MTVKEFAEDTGRHIKTIKRWIRTGNGIPEWLTAVNRGKPIGDTYDSTIPKLAEVYLRAKNGPPDAEEAPNFGFFGDDLATARDNMLGTVITKPDTRPNNDSLVSKELQAKAHRIAGQHDTDAGTKDTTIKWTAKAPWTQIDTDKATPDTDRTPDTEAPPAARQDNDPLKYPMLAILIAADAYSCGLITYRSIGNGFAVAFFALVGVAVAYASIRNAAKIKTEAAGYTSKNVAARQGAKNANKWLWGFGAVQFLLHAAAFDLFNPATYSNPSLAVGKFIICLCIPMGTMGIAVTLRE